MPDDIARAITVHLAAAHGEAERLADGHTSSPWWSVTTQISLVSVLLDLGLEPHDVADISVEEELLQSLRVLMSAGARSRWGLADRVTARRWLSELIDAVAQVDA